MSMVYSIILRINDKFFLKFRGYGPCGASEELYEKFLQYK
jgi:hypothetical protein